MEDPLMDDKEIGSERQFLAELDELADPAARIDALEARCRRAEAALLAMEERNLLWREAAPMGVCTVDGKGLVSSINRPMREMLSLLPGEPVTGEATAAVIQSSIGTMVNRCLDNRETLVFEQSCNDPSRPWQRLRFRLNPVNDTEGTVVGAMILGEDITELYQAQQAMRDSEQRFRTLFKSAPIAMMERDASELKAYVDTLRGAGVTDFQHYFEKNPDEISRCLAMIRTTNCNAAFLELMEVSDEVAMGNGIAMARFENSEAFMLEILLLLTEGCLVNEKERVFTTLAGRTKTVLVKSLVFSNPTDSFSRVIVAMIDISQRKQAEQALKANEQKFREQANHDSLSGLYNRRYLYASLEELIGSAAATATPLSTIFMDIDHFKEVVDTFGHLSGSQAIRELAETINSALQSPAYAVAYAGDEFVVVLPGFSAAQAVEKALDIQHRIRQSLYLRDQGAGVRLQASFGIATFPDHGKDMRELLGAADQALFAGKRSGRDSVRLYEAFPGSVLI